MSTSQKKLWASTDTDSLAAPTIGTSGVYPIASEADKTWSHSADVKTFVSKNAPGTCGTSNRSMQGCESGADVLIVPGIDEYNTKSCSLGVRRSGPFS